MNPPRLRPPSLIPKRSLTSSAREHRLPGILEERRRGPCFGREALLRDADGLGTLVDQQEAPAEALGRHTGCATAAEEVGDQVIATA